MKRLLTVLGALAFAVLLFPVLNSTSSSVLSAMPGPHAYKLYCASDDFYRHFCPINAYGGVEIIRQKSEAACIYGRTWGLTGDSIWVDRGCRADFAVGTGGYAYDSGNRGGRTFYCSSDDFNFHGCRVNTYGGVRLIRQRSEAPCIYGQTWGFDERGVWVDRGCRADFATGGGGYRRYHHDRDDDDDRDDWRH
ncbi:MAG TPA: DUF3011 domain-containing protein [Candidatus Acidoferrum sp.]|nr:DUF3011 domain-containing protein [Candidatus Acidoferrum sp.]